MNIPNLISLGRLLIVPVVVWAIIDDQMALAFWLFVGAGLSDAVDGFLARRMSCISVVGEYLDPLADKALLMSIYVTLGTEGYLPSWIVILVVSRDVLIIGGAMLFHLLTHNLKMSPLYISKINTVAQIVLAGAVLGSFALDVDAEMAV
ncbi:MAG: CDP-alcohol phosphatidyltransferase family protein, partial [Alphaproteobacteria bacterium]|nr:CDP-alcohol phosphatidyltransferase family protein [Alphaproteobacteria bacterium]